MSWSRFCSRRSCNLASSMLALLWVRQGAGLGPVSACRSLRQLGRRHVATCTARSLCSVVRAHRAACTRSPQKFAGRRGASDQTADVGCPPSCAAACNLQRWRAQAELVTAYLNTSQNVLAPAFFQQAQIETPASFFLMRNVITSAEMTAVSPSITGAVGAAERLWHWTDW